VEAVFGGGAELDVDESYEWPAARLRVGFIGRFHSRLATRLILLPSQLKINYRPDNLKKRDYHQPSGVFPRLPKLFFNGIKRCPKPERNYQKEERTEKYSFHIE